MILTEQHIDYISNNLELYGLKNEALKEDILDHICTYIENTEEDSFENAYQTAINKFGGYLNINQIQKETQVQLYLKSAKIRNRLLYISGFLTAVIMSTGSLFKIMHWPYAGIILFISFVVFILITLPLYFYTKYKEKTLKYQS